MPENKPCPTCGLQQGWIGCTWCEAWFGNIHLQGNERETDIDRARAELRDHKLEKHPLAVCISEGHVPGQKQLLLPPLNQMDAGSVCVVCDRCQMLVVP